MGERNRLVNGLTFHPGSVDAERTPAGAPADKLGAVDPKSLSVPTKSSVSTTASAAPAAVIAAAWAR